MEEPGAFFNMMSVAGDALTMLAYYLLQSKKISAESPLFLSMNCLGSTIILIPLLCHSSLALILDQMVWLSISIYGVIQNAPGWIKFKRHRTIGCLRYSWLRPLLNPSIFLYKEKKNR